MLTKIATKVLCVYMVEEGETGEKTLVCPECGWDANKKSKAKDKRKALTLHMTAKHGKSQDTGEGTSKKGGTGMETRGKKAKLRGELRKLKMRFRKLPRDVQEMATSELEMMNEYISGLAVSKSPTEEELEMIDMAIEDDLKWAMKDYENEARETQETEKKDESKKKDTVDLLEEELNEEMQQVSREYRVERMQQQLEDLRERRGKKSPQKPDDGEEIPLRELPNGETVRMTDKEYSDWLLRYENIHKRRMEREDSDKVEFLFEDPKSGKLSPIKVSSEAYFRYLQSSGSKGQTDDVKRMQEQYQKDREFYQKQIEDQKWAMLDKRLGDMQAQQQYDPWSDFLNKFSEAESRGMIKTGGDDTDMQLLKNQGQFMHDTMQIMGRTSDHSMNIMERAADAYLEGKTEEKKDKIRRKSILAEEGRGPEPPGPGDLGKLSEKVEENLGERGASGYYFCSKCQGDHAFNSPMGQEHITYREMKSSEKINRKNGKEVGLY